MPLWGPELECADPLAAQGSSAKAPRVGATRSRARNERLWLQIRELSGPATHLRAHKTGREDGHQGPDGCRLGESGGFLSFMKSPEHRRVLIHLFQGRSLRGASKPLRLL